MDERMRRGALTIVIVGLVAGGWSRNAFSAADLLLYAVCKRDKVTITLLLADKKDVNTPKFGALGMTALDLALVNGFADVVEILLNAGAKPTQRTFYYPCSRDDMNRLCQRFPEWQRHEGCRVAQDGDKWPRACKAPDPFCSQVLSDY